MSCRVALSALGFMIASAVAAEGGHRLEIHEGLAQLGGGLADWWVASGGDGDGSFDDPFGRIQDALDVAAAGETVAILPGVYAESLASVRSGSPGSPISVRAVAPRTAVVRSDGRVLDVGHSHLAFDGLVFDGEYGERDTVLLRDGADFAVLRDCEVRRSSRDCVDIGAPEGVLIDGCLIHRCLHSSGIGTDAHGIVGGAVRDLVIRDTEVHTFSGDAVQFDPGREAPGWDRITIDGCLFWLAPLARDENGFPAGAVPGENAVDTKTWNDASRATLTIRDTVAFGFRDNITNMSAFNLKENVDVLVDGVTVFDSEIAFRLRGPTPDRPAGAWVTVENAIVYDVDKAVRYEDDIENLEIHNTTVGAGVLEAFEAADADSSFLDVRNFLILASDLPPEAEGASNLAVDADAFVDPARANYRLRPGSPAIDAGETIPSITLDRERTARPQGAAHDVGAYERCLPSSPCARTRPF